MATGSRAPEWVKEQKLSPALRQAGSRAVELEVKHIVWRLSPAGDNEESVQIIIRLRIGFGGYVKEFGPVLDSLHGKKGVSVFIIKFECASSAWMKNPLGVNQAAFSSFSWDDVGYRLAGFVGSITAKVRIENSGPLIDWDLLPCRDVDVELANIAQGRKRRCRANQNGDSEYRNKGQKMHGLSSGMRERT